MIGYRFTLEACLQCVKLIPRETEMVMNGSQPLNCLFLQTEIAGPHTSMRKRKL